MRAAAGWRCFVSRHAERPAGEPTAFLSACCSIPTEPMWVRVPVRYVRFLFPLGYGWPTRYELEAGTCELFRRHYGLPMTTKNSSQGSSRPLRDLSAGSRDSA